MSPDLVCQQKQQLSKAQRELAAVRDRLQEGEGDSQRDRDEATELQQQLLAKEVSSRINPAT